MRCERLGRAFVQFDVAHPEVWKLYQRFAWELRRAGHHRGSSEQIIQRLRWETMINPERGGGYKISNNHRKRYALKMVAYFPSFEGFFRFRG